MSKVTVRPHVLAVAAIAAACAAVAIPALTSAQSSGGARDITVREKVPDRNIHTVDVAPRSKSGKFSAGDRISARQLLFNNQNQRVGTLYTDCVGMGPTASLFKATVLCTAVYRFHDGEITGVGAGLIDAKTLLAITGGTGAYRGAKGEVQAIAPVHGYQTVETLQLEG